MCRRALRRARLFDLVAACAFVLGLVFAAAGAALHQPWLTWSGAAIFGLSVLTTIFGTWVVWPWAVLDDEGSVILSFVHPDFAAAVLSGTQRDRSRRASSSPARSSPGRQGRSLRRSTASAGWPR